MKISYGLSEIIDPVNDEQFTSKWDEDLSDDFHF